MKKSAKNWLTFGLIIWIAGGVIIWQSILLSSGGRLGTIYNFAVTEEGSLCIAARKYVFIYKDGKRIGLIKAPFNGAEYYVDLDDGNLACCTHYYVSVLSFDGAKIASYDDNDSVRYNELAKTKDVSITSDGENYYLRRTLTSTYIEDANGNTIWMSPHFETLSALLLGCAIFSEILAVFVLLAKEINPEGNKGN